MNMMGGGGEGVNTLLFYAYCHTTNAPEGSAAVTIHTPQE